MKLIQITALLLLLSPISLFAIDITRDSNARLDITSRTSFGIDMDNPYRYGLANELTQVDLIFGLAGYQPLSNREVSSGAVGFIDLTLFHLDLIKVAKEIGYNKPGGIGTNRYQTGEFLAGIAKGPWLFQLNAQANEPFTSPWNKGLQFVNDGFKLSWAYLDTMVDVRRVKSITGVSVITRRGEENMIGAGDIKEGHGTMLQFGYDQGDFFKVGGNIADRFGADEKAHMVAAMYNHESFGINVKFGTEKTFLDSTITEDNRNGLAYGFDSVIKPQALKGLKIFASFMGTDSFDKRLPDENNKLQLYNNTSSLFGGARVGYSIGLGDDISLEPWAGLDLGAYKITDTFGSLGYEASFGMTMRFPGAGGWLKDYILNSDGRVFPGMSLGYKMYIEPEINNNVEHSVKFTLFEPKGNDGLLRGLGSEIIIDLVDLSDITRTNPIRSTNENDPPRGFCVLGTAYFDYEINNLGRMPGSLVPWTILYYDNLPGINKNKNWKYGDPEEDRYQQGRYNNLKIDLGLNLENAVSNTTFGIAWNSGSLLRKLDDRPELGKRGYFRFMVEIRL